MLWDLLDKNLTPISIGLFRDIVILILVKRIELHYYVGYLHKY